MKQFYNINAFRGNTDLYMYTILTNGLAPPTTTAGTTTATPTPTLSQTTTVTPTTTTATPAPTTTDTPTTDLPTTTPTLSTTTTNTPTPSTTNAPTTTLPPTTPTPTITPTPSTTTQFNTTTVAPTTTLTPTTSTHAPTTTTAPVTCFDKSSNDPNVCSNKGVCTSTGECQCNTNAIGKECEIDMQVSSSSYVVFDTTTNTSAINVDSANSVPGTSGTVNYQMTSSELQLSSSFGSTQVAKQSICLNPSIIVAGVQTFIAFSLPSSLPSGTAAEVWISHPSGSFAFSSSVRSSSTGYVFELDAAGAKSSTPVTLATNTIYLILIHVDSFGTYVVSQIIDKV